MEKRNKRPLSPFLMIYRPQITSLFSILERITGVFLVLLLVFVYITLKVESIGLSFYGVYSFIYLIYKSGNVVILGLLLFLLINFYYHILFGIRYLYWDKYGGKDDYVGIDMNQLYKSNIGLLLISIVLGIINWQFILLI